LVSVEGEKSPSIGSTSGFFNIESVLTLKSLLGFKSMAEIPLLRDRQPRKNLVLAEVVSSPALEVYPTWYFRFF
jgi:hypothetical protein